MKLPKIWPAFASGILVLACFPPIRLGLLVFVALVPWLIYLRDCDGKRAFRSGILFGFIFWLGEFSFVAKFVGNWTGSLPLGCVPYLAGCFVGSFYFALFGWLANMSYRRGALWLVPVAWAGVEVFRSYIVGLAFPYGLLAMPLTAAPAVIQAAHYGTVYFVSAWVMIADVIVAELISGRRFVEMRWYGAVFIAVLSTSIMRYASPMTGAFRHLVAGQPGVDMAFGDQTHTKELVAARVAEIEAVSKGAHLLVLPEGIADAGATMPPPILFHVSKGLPVVFGGQRGQGPARQSAFSYDGHWEYADKTRLVIFGEYVPFRQFLPASFRLPSGDLVPGDKTVTLNVGNFKVGSALCFEALFPDVTYRHALNGANILAVMSIDDWYFGTNAPEQLRDASNWRAIEAGIPVVRAASLGYSMIVDQRGRTVAEVPLNGTREVAAQVQVPEQPDLFPLLPVFPYLAVLSLIGIPIWDQWARRNPEYTSN